MRYKSRASIKRSLIGIWIAVFSMLILPGGCTRSRQAVDDAGRIKRDAQLTCDPSLSGRCAIPSLWQDLADRVEQADDGLHYVSLFDDGRDELLARLHMMRAARESIIMQSFICEDDDVGGLIFQELLAAACRGVNVRIILDQFGTYMSAEVLASLATAHQNFEIKFYSPILNRAARSAPREFGALFVNFSKLNERMHNKLFAVDRRIGIVGGRNIQNAYYNHGQEINFKDLGMLAIGPVAEKMYESFDIYWHHHKCEPALRLPDIARAALQLDTTGQILSLPQAADGRLDWLLEAADAYSPAGGWTTTQLYPVHRIEYIADWPVKDEKTPIARQWDSTERIQAMILSAQQSIIMQTPYLIHDFKGIRQFQDYRADHAELDVAMLTNSLASSDIFYVYALSFKQRQYYLEQLKCRLYEFKPFPADALQMMPPLVPVHHLPDSPNETQDSLRAGPTVDYSGPPLCLHSKFIVVDDMVSYVGSHNFDPRSNHLNTENGLIVWDEQVAMALHRLFDWDTAPQNSWVAARDPKMPVLGNISDAIASISSSLPIFDLWPIYYSNSYELIEGRPALPPGHPDFYHHYRNVGAFPQVGLVDQFAVRLSIAFVALGRGFL